MKQKWRLAASVRFIVAGFTAVFVIAAASVEPLAEEAALPPPPPRTIDDIAALLDKAEIADKGEYKRLLAKAGEDPPEGASKADLAKFYIIRGATAGDLGNITQSLADLREAVRLVEEGNLGSSASNARLYVDLAWAELQIGNYQSAIRAARKSNKARPIGQSSDAIPRCAYSNRWVRSARRKPTRARGPWTGGPKRSPRRWMPTGLAASPRRPTALDR